MSFLNCKKLCLPVLVFLSLVISFFLGKGYKDVNHRDDYRHLVVEGKIAVYPTVVDFVEVKNLLIGVRMPSGIEQCGRYEVILVKNEKIYFVFDIGTKKYSEFFTTKKFEGYLRKKDLSLYELGLDLDKSKKLWDKYSSDYKTFSIYKKCFSSVAPQI